MDGAVLFSQLAVIQTVDWDFKRTLCKSATSAQTQKPYQNYYVLLTVPSAVCKKQQKRDSSALWHRITVTVGTFHIFFSFFQPRNLPACHSLPVFGVRSEAGEAKKLKPHPLISLFRALFQVVLQLFESNLTILYMVHARMRRNMGAYGEWITLTLN